MVRSLAKIIMLCFILSSCNEAARPLTVNVDFAKTNYGYLNSGGYEAGSFFRWNKKQSTLTFLGNIDGFDVENAEEVGVDIDTTYEHGVELDAQFSSIEKASIEGAIKANVTLTIIDAKRHVVSGTITKISKYLSSHTELFDEWNFREVASDPEQYYLVVRDVTVGDQVELKIANESKAGGDFPIKVGGASINVRIAGSGLGKLKGENAVMMFNFLVYRAVFKPNGEGGQNPSFEVIKDLNLEGLPSLLRKVGNSS